MRGGVRVRNLFPFFFPAAPVVLLHKLLHVPFDVKLGGKKTTFLLAALLFRNK